MASASLMVVGMVVVLSLVFNVPGLVAYLFLKLARWLMWR